MDAKCKCDVCDWEFEYRDLRIVYRCGEFVAMCPACFAMDDILDVTTEVVKIVK